MIKQYLGILLSAVYAILIRLLGEWNVIDINSFSYLIIAPMAMGFIPFYFSGKGVRTSWVKAIFFPLIAVLVFLLIAVITHLEDLICFIIIGAPYIGFSIVLSVILYSLTKEKEDEPFRKGLSVLALPLVLGMIEKQFPKQDTDQLISRSVVIDRPANEVWKHLFAVPDLGSNRPGGWLHAMGIPRPLYATYDRESNTRLGYFENGIVLHESVTESETGHRLTFAINIGKSFLGNSPTLNHILKNKQVTFRYIRYELEKQADGKTLLQLSTKYTIHSNLPFYGKFWGKVIIKDFEEQLLQALKEVLEKGGDESQTGCIAE